MKLWNKLLGNGAFRFGAAVLLLLVAIAVAAPWLGTVDPSAMDSNHINTAAGARGAFALPGDIPVQHVFWMGSDNLGRDIFSRVVYGTRTSLLVAGFTACVALCVGGLLGMLAGYFRHVD